MISRTVLYIHRVRAILLLSGTPEDFDPGADEPRWKLVSDRYPVLSQAFEATVYEVEGGSEWVQSALRDLDPPGG